MPLLMSNVRDSSWGITRRTRLGHHTPLACMHRRPYAHTFEQVWVAVDEQTWQLGDLRALPDETANSAPAPKPGRGQVAGPLYTVQLEEEERAGGTGGRGGSTGASGRTMAVELGRLAPSNPKLQVCWHVEVVVFQARNFLGCKYT